MAGPGRNLTVYLTSDVTRFGRGLKSAETRLEKFGRFAKGAMVGVAAAAGVAATTFAVDGVKAFVQDDKAAAKLAKTMKNLGKAQDTGKAEDYIETLMKATGVADDDLRPAFEKLMLATGDTDSAMRLLKTALDTSVGAGKPLDTIVSSIAKGLNGQAGALKRVVPGLDDAAIKADPLNSILGQLNKKFGGQAADQAGTYGGQMQSVATAFGELQEAFGKGLVESLAGSNSSMGSMDDTLYTLAPAMEDLGTALGDIAVSLGAIAQYIGPVVDKFNELNNLGDGFLTNGVFVNTIKAINGDFTPGNVVRGTAPGGTLTPAQLAAIANGSPTSGSFYDQGGLPSTNPSRVAQRYRDANGRADARNAQRDARTRTRP
jgi:hypothetical protein